MNQAVVRRETMDIGVVIAPPVRDAGEFWYRVQFGNGIRRLVEDALDYVTDAHESIESLAKSGQWGHIRAFRSAMVVERIKDENKNNRNTVYTYQSQRILFEPHQYKPLLKLLDSPDRRILVADEVGLGKTIEAGLILAELEARRSLDRVLVICPSRLLPKWKEEMRRKFDRHFDVLTSADMRQFVEDLDDNRIGRPLRAIMSFQSLRSEKMRLALSRLDPIDLVIFDEAHHARNPGTQTTELLRDVCRISTHAVLLTATPLHLGSQDLFTLLNALRPSEFREPHTFDASLRRHAAVYAAAAHLRSQDTSELREAISILEALFPDRSTRHGRRNPIALQLIEDLRQANPRDRREWVELERRTQELHPLATIVTRTRKREVQATAPERKPWVRQVHWTAAEFDVYERLVGGADKHGWLRPGLSLGQIQRARQAASCLPAAIEAYGLSVAVDDDSALEMTDVLPSEISDIGIEASETPGAVFPIEHREFSDSKHIAFHEILDAIWREEPQQKVLVFTFFRGTARYLERRLMEAGIGVVRIDGEVPSDPRNADNDERGRRMRQFREDAQTRVMVSTEVGSEGLDFQFCHHLVNYDLPWNPMVVEQRIGRIDRFGQKSPVVNIHNLVVANTVEDRILYRLYERIGIFKQSIGESELIIGETVRELHNDYITGQLTPEDADRRVALAESAIARGRQECERLEQRTGELFGHDEYLQEELRRVRRLGRYISEEAILALLATYLDSCHGGTRYWRDETDPPHVYRCRITDGLRHELLDAARSGGTWSNPPSGVMAFTTRSEVAYDHTGVELVNATHPLLKAAAAGVQERLKVPAARVGQAFLEVTPEEELPLRSGRYYLVVFMQVVEGIRGRRLFEPIVWNCDGENLVDAEIGERLMHLVLESATESLGAGEPIAMPDEVWSRIEGEARERNRRLREQESAENNALYERRRSILLAEYDHVRAGIETRMRTAESRGQVRMLPAWRGQLDKVETRLRENLAQLDGRQRAVVDLLDPLAACLITLKTR